MAVNPARWCAGHFNFRELFFNPRSIPGGKLNAPEHAPVEGELFFHFAIDNDIAKNRNIAQAGFGSMIYGEAFGPLEGAINHRHVQLKTRAFRKVIAGKELRNSAVQILTRRIGGLHTIHLYGAKMSKLLGNATEEPGSDLAAGLGCGVKRAQVAGKSRRGQSAS